MLTTLAEAWAERGKRVCVITLASTESDFFSLDARVTRIALGATAVSASWSTALPANVRRLWRIRRAVRRESAPVVVPFIGITNILTVVATLGSGVRVVACERNDPSRQSLGSPWDRMRPWAYRRAAAVTATNDEVAAALTRWVRPDDIYVVPTPVAPPSPSSPAPERLVLSVGRLHPQKAHDVLLRAFALSGLAELGWRLVILGEGDGRASLDALGRELGVDLELPGQTGDTTGWYRRAAVFALTSRFEGVPNALLEAMAHGTACVVTDTPGARAVVEDGRSALVAPVDDVGAVAALLRRLADDSILRQSLGAAAAERVADRSIDRVLPLWERAIFGS